MNSRFITVTLIFTGLIQSTVDCFAQQTAIPRIEQMPDMPEPFKMLDWKEKAIALDSVIYDFNLQGNFQPYIWLDNSQHNISQQTYGIYTVIGDIRQGPGNNSEYHEALCSIGSLLGAGLVGINKTAQNGHNFVKMVQNYFNTDNSWNIVMNNTNPKVASLGGGYGHDWWYDVFPNLLFYGVCDIFHNVDNARAIQHMIADQFYKADSVLNGNYDFSYFDYSKMQGMRNNIPYQQDAAAGHAYVLLCAYSEFKDPRYLKGCESALYALLKQKESRFYEILMPFGAYVAARLNAEQGTHFDVTQIINWTFDGCTSLTGRTGWGVIAGRWGNFDVSGMQGSITDGGGYGFLMNTFDMAWPLVSMVKYDSRYTKAIGKWMLNASNTARLFYPFETDDKNQWLPEKKNYTKGVIAYEGLRKEDYYNKPALRGISPVAQGDGPRWKDGEPDVTMFSIYSSAQVGIYGSIIRATDIKGILQLNCNATDFYSNNSFPTYIYYNPFKYSSAVIYKNSSNKAVELFDAVTHEIVAKKITDKGEFEIPADQARLIVVIPYKSNIVKRNGKYYVGDIVVAYM